MAKSVSTKGMRVTAIGSGVKEGKEQAAMGDATRLSECCLEADEATQHAMGDFTVGKSRIRCPSPMVVMRWTDGVWPE